MFTLPSVTQGSASLFVEDMKPMFVEGGEGDLVEINCLCWIPTDIIATCFAPQALESVARCPVLTFALVIQPASIDGTILELQIKR